MKPLLVVILVLLGSALFTLLVIRSRSDVKTDPVTTFLLAGRALGRMPVVNLLLSSSFGINALFYAAWLGFSIGGWALIIQAAWAASFFLLMPHAGKFQNIHSLHDFLGRRFGAATKLLAAICSLVGIMYLVGWEVGIGKTAISSLLTESSSVEAGVALSTAEFVAVAIVFGTLLYTLLGGLWGNAIVNKFLNFFKIVIVGVLVLLSMRRLFSLEASQVLNSFFPSMTAMRANLGLWGLLTNIMFNISWQFVDNSSWQSIIGGSGNPKESTARNLRYSGLTIFLTIGLLGTLLGISLSTVSDINPDNILTMSVLASTEYETWLLIGMIAVIAACMMSLVDGMLLASALTVVVDILPSLRSRVANARTSLGIVRVTLVLVAILSVWGIDWVFRLSGASLFDFVYIVILTQLSLIGPVAIGLYADYAKRQSSLMWFPIVLGLLAGFGSVVIGTTGGLSYLVDGAGTFAILASILSALFIARRAHRTSGT